MSQEKQSKLKSKIITEVDDFGRKKFTLKQNGSDQQVEDQKQKRLIDTGKYASTLIGRQQKVDIEKYIGKIQGNKKKKITQVFYCQVCQIGFKCDLAYITHINSSSHNRKLGMNMKVEAVSVETVVDKLAKLAQQKSKSKHQKMIQKKLGKNWQAELLRKQQQQQKVSKQNQLKLINNKNNDNVKKNKNENNHKDQEHELKQKQQDHKQKQQNQVQIEDQLQDQDQILMKSLGLPTSFGQKRKNIDIIK